MDACRTLTDFEKCLAMIAHGRDALHAGEFARAEGAFRIAQVVATKASAEQARDLAPLVLYHMSLLRARQDRGDESRELCEKATAQLDDRASSSPDEFFQYLMASALMELGEYRRAIAFWEQAIRLDQNRENPLHMADLLRRVGECYSRTGLRDHAVIPLRAAANTFRKHPEDPRTAGVLVTLGNALRKSAPGEAEACFREAAELHVAKGHLLTATTPWMNLGIICSEQGRFNEALELYEKVLRIREQSAGTEIARIANVWNNMASNYRRMGKFADAFASIDRTIELLKEKGGGELAAGYGTRGLIFRDAGRDEEAVTWLQKAYEEHMKLPGVRLDSVVEDLENEIAALKRLGRLDEEKSAEKRLEDVRAVMKAVPQVSHDLRALNGPTRCAVLIEIEAANGLGRLRANREAESLGDRLHEILEAQNLGWYAGQVTIPESATLIFYGPDAEAIFVAIEPSLKGESICGGARVTIRREDGSREVFVPRRSVT